MMANTSLAKQLVWQNRIKLLFFISAMIVAGVVVFAVQGLLLSLVLAMIINYILSPIVSQMEARGYNRITAVSVTFVGFTLLMAALVGAISPFIAKQISGLQGELPKYIDGTVALVAKWQGILENASGGMIEYDNSSNGIAEWLDAQSRAILLNLPQYLSSSASVMILSPFIGFFLIKDGRQFARNILGIVPNSIFEMTLNLQFQINDQIAQYFRARFLEAAIVGFIVLVGLLAVGFPYAVVLALFAAVTNLIPYIGPIVGAVPAIIIALINQDSQVTLFLVIMVYAVAQLVDVFFIIPLVVAKIVDLHPVTVILAVLVGAQLLGVLGMLISIPIFSALKVTFVTVYRHLTDFG